MRDMPDHRAPAATIAAPGARTRELGVLVIDDHRVFTELLAFALDRSPSTYCAAIATSIREGLAKTAAYRPEVVVLDARMPDGNGLDAIPVLLATHPDARVVLLTAHPRADLADQAIAAGASAFLAKDDPLDLLLDAVLHATRAQPVVSKSMPVQASVRLTPRERDVLTLMAQGHDAARIADLLGLSRHTVRDHIKAVLASLDARSQLDAVTRAIGLGLVGTRDS